MESLGQPVVPFGVDEARYKYCLNQGVVTAESYSEEQAYCQGWAGSSVPGLSKADRLVEYSEAEKEYYQTSINSPVD